ncbi:hypothetical protein [Kitasatospora kifunensis]|uniref:Uncharacterized protein n=1 Tax=Kitasatospora kifunensis TaxID=58351 RepID=A0A7W7R3C3_KITKI|nr:hypothetical protein [Kitasatospora kifunensis]MBB4924594.1 hypothetical protein [Kitasatospora kifunensis]
MTDFAAVLPSRHSGIRFAATITAASYPEHLPPHDGAALARLVRTTLRAVAADISRRRDPVDLPGAQDECAYHLARSHDLPGHPGTGVKGAIRLTLDEGNQAAVKAVLEAQRQQTIRDVVFEQETRTRAGVLSDPALLLASRSVADGTPSAVLPDQTAVERQALLFKALRTDDDPLEYQVLGVVRSFLSSFEENHQKLMLVTALASGMRKLDGDEHADALEALAAERGVPDGSHEAVIPTSQGGPG